MRLIVVCLAWGAGLLAAGALPAFHPQAWLGLLAACGLLAWMAASARLRTAWALAAVVCAGGLRLAVVPQGDDLAWAHGRVTAVTGVISAPPEVDDAHMRLRLRAESLFDGTGVYPARGTLLLTTSLNPSLRVGDRVTAAGILREPGEFDAFSYTDYLARQGIYSLMRDATLTLVQPAIVTDRQQAIADLRAAIREVVLRAVPQPEAGLLMGIVLGSERDIDPAVREAFTRTGLAHIVAVSGFNMAVLTGAVLLVLRLWEEKRPVVVVVLALAIVGSYTALVDGGASVSRAALMCALVLCAPLVRRSPFLPATVAAAALLLTLGDPFALWDVGFQLSFAAVTGFAILLPPLQRCALRWVRARLAGTSARVANGAVSLVLVTLVAQIATTPVLLLHFQQVSLVSLVVNLLAMPVQPLILIGGLLAVGVSVLLPALASVIFAMPYLLLWWTTAVVEGYAALPEAALTVFIWPGWVAAFYGVLIGAFMVNHYLPERRAHWARRWLPAMSIIMALGLAGLLLLDLGRRPDGRLHVRWLDVGRGSAILLQTPAGGHILIDGGAAPARLMRALGEQLPFYKRTLDALVLTQPDGVDNRALLEVLRFYGVRVVLTNGQPNASETQAALATLLAAFPQVVVRQGSTLQTSDGVRLHILNPAMTPALATPLEQAALVLRVDYGARSVLLAGSVSADHLLTRLPLPHTDIVQLSPPQSTRWQGVALTRTMQPSALVVQAGRASAAHDALNEIAATSALPPLLRTDVSGQVHLVTDGQRVWQMR